MGIRAGRAFALVVVIGALGVGAAPASADTIAVTTSTDEFADPGPGAGCSLREAVQTANTDANFGGCTQTSSSSGPDTIDLPPGTFTLTGAALENANNSGDIDVNNVGLVDEGGDLTIQGAGDGTDSGADTIVDAADLDRAFDVQNAISSLDFTVQDLRIRNGNATDGSSGTATTDDDGGAILMRDNDGAVTVQRATIENSDAVRWGGALSFHLAATGSGAPLEVIDSELVGNTAASGGAIWTGNGGFSGSGDDVSIGGATRILRSTFTQNVASRRGGAIYLVGPPDGSSTSGLSVLNSTIHDNDSGTGGVASGGGAIAIGAGESRLYVHFTTITDNTSALAGTAGGIQADNTTTAQRVYLRGSILAGNLAAGTDVNCLRLTSPTAFGPADSEYNVESADTCGLVEPVAGTDNKNESAALVSALGDSGGETRTRVPVAGSPVLDFVPSAACIDFNGPTTVPVTSDQRGLPRPAAPPYACDAGAVEAVATAVADATTVSQGSGANAIDVLANDTGDAAAKRVMTAGDAPYGTVAVTLNGAGVTYTPDAGYCGPDSFIYTNPSGSTATVTVTVTTCAATTPPPTGSPFDLKAAIRKCKRKYPKGQKRKRCIKKAKKKAQAS